MQPTPVLVICHGSLASAMVDSAHMIVGAEQRAVPLAFLAGMGPEDLAREIDVALGGPAGAGPPVLVLTDLPGGTPARVSAERLGAGAEVVTGVSLPMLLEVLLADPASSVPELAGIAVRAGREGVRDLGQDLRDQGVIS